MELRHLRYFHVVAETLSFSRAAALLHIAQPPLSRQIRQLEDMIGAVLIDRDSRPIALTLAGKYFYEQTRQVMSRLREIEEGTRCIARHGRVRLGIGFVPSVMCGLLPELIRQFRLAEPGVETGFTELVTAEQAAALKLGRIDVGFGRLQIDDPEIACVTLLREPLLVALPASHYLASSSVAVSLKDLGNDTLIVYPARPRPGYADQVLALFAREATCPTTINEANEMQTALGLVAAGIGIALVPASASQVRVGVTFRRLAHDNAVSPVIMNYRRNDESRVLARFREMAALSVLLPINASGPLSTDS